jgi:hypothetical protein
MHRAINCLVLGNDRFSQYKLRLTLALLTVQDRIIFGERYENFTKECENNHNLFDLQYFASINLSVRTK